MSDEREHKNPFKNDLWDSSGPVTWSPLPPVVYAVLDVEAGRTRNIRYAGYVNVTTSKGAALAEAKVSEHERGHRHIVVAYRLDETTIA